MPSDGNRHLIVTLHGIRTYGRWQQRLEQILKEAKRKPQSSRTEFAHFSYGVFDLFKFIIPFARNSAVKKFRQNLQGLIEGQKYESIDIVAHSFGTYLAIRALQSPEFPTDVRIRKVILCGSVLPPDENLSNLVGLNRRIGELINDCGTQDGVLPWTLLVWGVGMAGRLGLHGFQGGSLKNRFFRLGHSGYFEGEDQDRDAFMKRWWAPILLTNKSFASHDDRSEQPSFLDRVWRALGENGAFVTFGIYATLLIIFGGSLFGLWRQAEYELQEALRKDSLVRAEQANRETARGDAVTGMLLALEALPDESARIERPFVLGAASALYAADYVRRETTVFHGVWDASFSPYPARRVLTISDDNMVRLWDVDSEKKPIVLQGHKAQIFGAVFSLDGARVLTASDDKTARLWDSASGEEIYVFRHDGGVTEAVFSPDEQSILTVSWDDSARLWDAKTGDALTEPMSHDGLVRAAFSPDGTRVVTTSKDSPVRLWDAKNGKELMVVEDHAASAAFSPDSTRLLTISDTARLWNVETGKEIAVFEGYEDGDMTAIFSPDGTRILTVAKREIGEHAARLWDASNGQEIGRLERHKHWLTHAVFSPDGERILTTSYDKTARVWDGRSGEELTVLRGHKDFVKGGTFSFNGTKILTVSNDDTARLWDATNGETLAMLVGHRDDVVSAVLSDPDEGLILTFSDDQTARLWDASTVLKQPVLSHENFATNASFSPDGTRIVTTSEDHTAWLWDAESGQELVRLRGHSHPVRSAAISPTARPGEVGVATASVDTTARLWDAWSGEELRVLSDHKDYVLSVIFSPNGESVLTTSADGTARLWDSASGEEIHVLPHDDGVTEAAFRSDGREILTISYDNTARLWDAESGEELIRFGKKGEKPLRVSFAYGPLVLTKSTDKMVRLWDVLSGAELAALEGLDDRVLGMASTIDGTTVATSSDGPIRLWNVERREALAVLEGHDYSVERGAFSSDASHLVTASVDKTARVWRVFHSTQALVDYAKAAAPRCLTQMQREELLLNPEPPRWCITGVGREQEGKPAKWHGKWPYHTKQWRDWLAAKDRGETEPLPGQ